MITESLQREIQNFIRESHKTLEELGLQDGDYAVIVYEVEYPKTPNPIKLVAALFKTLNEFEERIEMAIEALKEKDHTCDIDFGLYSYD